MGQRGPKPGSGGRPKKAIADKIADGNPGKRPLTVIDFKDSAADLEGQAMPKPSEFLSAKQKDGSTLCAAEIAFADIEGWQQVSQEQVIERSPDYIVLVTGMGETAVDEVMGREGWETITAIKNGAVYNADSYAMTRPAPRLAEAVVDLYNFLNGIAE